MSSSSTPTEDIEAEIDAEVQFRSSARLGDAAYFARRFAIRVFRILGGLALGYAALWLLILAVDELSKPFASLSPLGLIGGLVAGTVGIGIGLCALYAAFGPNPSREEWDKSRLESLRATISRQFRSEPFAARLARRKRERAQSVGPIRSAFDWFLGRD